MGQQQLLLVVIGVIIVGIAVLIGITLYRAYAVETKKDSLILDCVGIGTLAQKYYWTTQTMGGGGKSFIGFSIPLDFQPTANGNYRLTDTKIGELEITATGNEVVVDTDSVRVVMKITPKTYAIVDIFP